MTDNKKATPEEEGLAKTAELDADDKANYAEINEKAEEERNDGKVG